MKIGAGPPDSDLVRGPLIVGGGVTGTGGILNLATDIDRDIATEGQDLAPDPEIVDGIGGQGRERGFLKIIAGHGHQGLDRQVGAHRAMAKMGPKKGNTLATVARNLRRRVKRRK